LREIAVIVNAGAGAALGRPRIAAEIAGLFAAAGHTAEIIALGERQAPADAVRRAVAGGATIIAAAGGDGTVSGVAGAILESRAALGILPLGTLNHFAKDLRLPLDLREAVAVVAAGHLAHVDVGEVNGCVFVNNSSIGIYPTFVEAREALRRQGHRKWVAMAIAAWGVLRRNRRTIVSIDDAGGRRRWRTPFVFVGNNEYAIDGLRLGGRARFDGGRLFAYLTPRLHTRQLPMLLLRALIGRARTSGQFEIVPAAELWIDPAKGPRVRVALDGELRTMTTPLHYRIRPGALPVIVPRP
jgi:diacylglycerol kinase family enzyme